MLHEGFHEISRNSPVIRNFEDFKRVSDVIVANRWDKSLEDVKDKVYTRDIFDRD